jgi:hypothetical protein
LPQELRLAAIDTVAKANAFLGESYIMEFNRKFSVAAKEKGTAFRKTARADLNWIFTVQSECGVAKDNTVTMGERVWQIGKTAFRNTLAGCTVTVHEHLDGKVSIRYGPNVIGRFDAQGQAVRPAVAGKQAAGAENQPAAARRPWNCTSS